MLDFGNYEPQLSEWISSILSNGDVIFDIGAEIGWYSLLLSKRFPKSKIYSFEPIDELFQILNKNITRKIIVKIILLLNR